MKSTKRFLSLLFLFGHVSAYAMVPCNGPCDTPPNPHCRKKVNACKVDTDNLIVRESANVCGDLNVNGSIDNLELQLLLDSAVPPTDEVYNEFKVDSQIQPVLETIQDFTFSLNTIIPGTEIYPNAPIYGYNVETQELVLEGGPELSYTPDFNVVNVRYHGQNPQEIAITTPENAAHWYEHAISYFAQRGLPLPSMDVYPQYEGQFSTDFQLTGVAIKFQYEDDSVTMPYALDLIASADFFNYFAIDLYQEDASLKQNGRYYPIRIPITTDINEFKQLYCTQPIVYYDNLHRRITIHVPESSYELYRQAFAILCCNCATETDEISNLIAFDGTFSLMRRNANNELVSSSFADAQYLIQASPQVVVASENVYFGASEFFVDHYNFNDDGGVFTGLVIPLMNGGSAAFDFFTYNNNIGAFTSPNTPLVLPALEMGSQVYAQGDNPATTLREHFASTTNCTIFDTLDWKKDILGLPVNVMSGQTTPEENSFIAEPTEVDSSIILNTVAGHELFHTTQILQGDFNSIPLEAQALSLEMDVKLNSSVYSGNQPRRWTQYTSAVVRGDWPLTLPEVAANNQGFSTYGSSIFWKYLASQFDYNYQVMRRMNDILTHEALNPLLESNGITLGLVAFAYGFPIGTNPAGSLIALDQALQELHGLNVQEVFSNYSVSLALLRNNSSIPLEYQHGYPYWLASDTYPSYEELSQLRPLWATWWQEFQSNTVLQPGYTFPQYTGQTFVPVLDQDIVDYPMQDMTMLIFEVPSDVSSVTVDVTGEWRVSAVQFNSDGTPVGEFIMYPADNVPAVVVNGQTVVDLSSFTGTGPVRLVCAHVSMPTYQGLASFCGEGEYTGTISITRN